jgi:4'-phosphopantetheinyl transferase EntD
VIEELLPDWVAVAEAFEDPPDVELLGPERAAVAAAVPTRQREFATGRACARRALATLGFPPAPLDRGPRGEPRWPAGAVGSITHCAGYRAAAVAPAARAVAVGIDAEPDGPLPAGVLDLVALPRERPALAILARERPEVSWERLLFSAKESVYKSWYPLTGRWLGFEEAVVTFEPATGTFTADLLVPGPELDGGGTLTGFAGRWLARDGLVLTAIVVPASP